MIIVLFWAQYKNTITNHTSIFWIIGKNHNFSLFFLRYNEIQKIDYIRIVVYDGFWNILELNFIDLIGQLIKMK